MKIASLIVVLVLAAALVVLVLQSDPWDYRFQSGKRMQAHSAANLKEVGKALQRYVKRHKGVLPPLRDASAMQAALAPHTMDPQVFVHPITGEPYLPNPFLSGKKWKDFSAPEAVVAVYEARPYRGMITGRVLLFLDGHVKMIAEAGWPEIKRRSRIP